MPTAAVLLGADTFILELWDQKGAATFQQVINLELAGIAQSVRRSSDGGLLVVAAKGAENPRLYRLIPER